MEIKVKYINKDLPPLSYSENGDMLDLYVSGEYKFKKGETILVKFGVAMHLPDGWGAKLYPRSSTFKHHGLLLTNSVGVIDNSYNGDNDEIMAMFTATKAGEIKQGERVCQLEFYTVMPKLPLVPVEVLGNSDRSGYGSSGR